MSDIHFGNSVGRTPTVKVPMALKSITGKMPLIDAVFVVGDLTDGGTPAQYDQLVSVFSDKANIPDSVDVYYLMGNHDHFAANGQANYINKLKQPLNQYIIIKDYPFITVSQTGTGNRDYNAEAQAFLSEKLADATRTYPGKPVFVFFHVPPLNTCYGSSSTDGWGSDILLPILNGYPRAIVFSGHSHFPLGDPRSIHQDKFTAVNDGSTTYSEIEPNAVNAGIHPENYENITEAVIVNVMKNGNVEMERWDTYRNEPIEPRWTVEAPHDGSRFVYKGRNGMPAPAFTVMDKPVVTGGEESCTLTFPQATDNEAVHHYLIELADEDGIAAASYRKFSQFYLNSQMPASLTATIFGLPGEKKLTAQVTAVDSYGNRSAPLASEPFTLSSAPEPELAASWLFDDASDLKKATAGTDLIFAEAGGPITSAAGPDDGNKAIRIPVGSYLKAVHGLSAVGGQKVNAYSILMDFKIPATGVWYTFFQTDLMNMDDGELFVHKDSGTIGVGALGYSPDAIKADRWYRMVIVALNDTYCKIYLNGVLFHEGNGAVIDGRHALNVEGILFCADNDREDSELDLSEIRIWDRPLNAEKVKSLGGY
ncbi:MAG: metallophosphoesterase [Tannerella sp.]|nr:metallophosphoesterase [Tannerella sp.]